MLNWIHTRCFFRWNRQWWELVNSWCFNVGKVCFYVGKVCLQQSSKGVLPHLFSNSYFFSNAGKNQNWKTRGEGIFFSIPGVAVFKMDDYPYQQNGEVQSTHFFPFSVSHVFPQHCHDLGRESLRTIVFIFVSRFFNQGAARTDAAARNKDVGLQVRRRPRNKQVQSGQRHGTTNA